MGDAMHGTVAYTTLPASSPLPLPLAYLPPPLHRPPSPADDPGFQNRISPSILLIILILAAIFFLSGLLHLLVRFLLRPAARGRDDAGADATALQGQLQQLFHLHDAGVDQSFIDALPVFLYRSILGGGAAKAAASAAADPFDCAVCLCEFAADDRLRLLPKCSHAFHVECIDTWLLSHSTCPLCRRSLLADFSPCGGGGGGRSPLVYVLESGSDSSPEFAASQRLEAASSAHFGHLVEDEEAVAQVQKREEFTPKEEVVVPVKLGKFRSTAEVSGNQTVEGGGCSANPCLDQRRCFSMGSYEYVLDESSLLQVAVKPPAKKRPAVRKPGHRIAMSDCDCHSKREGFHGFDAPKTFDCGVAHPNDGCSKQPRIDKKESFSVSKIWMRGAKKAGTSGSRRVSSFRLSLQRTASDVAKRRVDVSPVTESEYNVSAWDKSEKSVGGSTVDWDVEAATAGGGGGGSGNELRLRADEAPSFARRTWLWIRGHL